MSADPSSTMACTVNPPIEYHSKVACQLVLMCLVYYKFSTRWALKSSVSFRRIFLQQVPLVWHTSTWYLFNKAQASSGVAALVGWITFGATCIFIVCNWTFYRSMTEQRQATKKTQVAHHHRYWEKHHSNAPRSVPLSGTLFAPWDEVRVQYLSVNKW